MASEFNAALSGEYGAFDRTVPAGIAMQRLDQARECPRDSSDNGMPERTGPPVSGASSYGVRWTELLAGVQACEALPSRTRELRRT